MKGFSGAVLERNAGLVVKYSSNERLLEQAQRQHRFHTLVHGLRACSVLGTTTEEGRYGLIMPYVNGVCPLHHIKPALSTIFEYIRERFDTSVTGDVPADVLLKKLEGLQRRIWLAKHVPPAWITPLEECRAVFAQGLKEIPLGDCHGDFTFTNMLQTDTELVLVDFLDNVFDSVLLDMVKLRQDTAHRWVNVVHDRVVEESKLKAIDASIEKELRWYECYRRYYRALQQFNLLRILPYCQDGHATNYVIQELNNL